MTATPLRNFFQELLLSNSSPIGGGDDEDDVHTGGRKLECKIVSDNCGQLPDRARQLVGLAYLNNQRTLKKNGCCSRDRWETAAASTPTNTETSCLRRRTSKKNRRALQQGGGVSKPSSSSSSNPIIPCRRVSMETSEADEWVKNYYDNLNVQEEAPTASSDPTTGGESTAASTSSQSETDQSCLRWLLALESKQQEEIGVDSSSSGFSISSSSISTVNTEDCFQMNLLSDHDDNDDSDFSSSTDSEDDESFAYDDDDSDVSSVSSFGSLYEELQGFVTTTAPMSSSSTTTVEASQNHNKKRPSTQASTITPPHEWILPSNTILPCSLQHIFRQATKDPTLDIEKAIHKSLPIPLPMTMTITANATRTNQA